MEQQSAKFEGWAVVELMGHQREAGFVTTQYFGGPALFQVDVPELTEREVTLTRPEWVNGDYCPAGTKVVRGAIQARTRLVSPSAIYARNPCTEDVVRKMLEDSVPRPILAVTLPEGKRLEAPEQEDDMTGHDASDGEIEDEQSMPL